MSTSDSSQTVHCLVHHIEEVEEEEAKKKENDGEGTSSKVRKSSPGFKVLLEWFCMTKESGKTTCLKRLYL